MNRREHEPIKGYGFECDMCERMTWVHASNTTEAIALWLCDEGGTYVGHRPVCDDCRVNELGE